MPFDITAAGHILFNVSVADGVREVKEEHRLHITYNQLNDQEWQKSLRDHHLLGDSKVEDRRTS